MTLLYDMLSNSTMPDRFKRALKECMEFIESQAPQGLVQILLFGSLARSNITMKSDIDLCLVFEDWRDMNSSEMRTFRGMLRGASLEVDIDVVTCTVSQLGSNSCLLYQEINRDKIALSS